MLTEVACRSAVPREREYKISDVGGLSLRIRPTGLKTWCWKYSYAGREKRLTIGRYPEVSLKQARLARDKARGALAEGVDPSHEKKLSKIVIAAEALNTFEDIARAWHAEQADSRSARYSEQILNRLVNDVFPILGPMPIRAITPRHVLAVLRRIEERGAHEMAHRVRLHISDIFVWAIASSLAEQDPAHVVRKALKPTDPKLRPAMVRLGQVRQVLVATEGLPDVYWATLLASRLLALTAARPGVVRLAERTEFEDLDGSEPIWRIPAAKMKLTRQRKKDVSWEFVVPLSLQAVQVVKLALAVSRSPTLLFPGVRGWRRPISDSTLSKHYREAGFAGQHVPHGWRSSFSTIMNELAAIDERDSDREIIDMMLAHAKQGVEPIYNRAAYMPRRREIAQRWADLLTKGLPPPELLLPPELRAAREAGHDGTVDRRRPRQSRAAESTAQRAASLEKQLL